VSGTTTDRAGAVRAALRTLVARHGFHGASMGAVASEAGVATGTAYVHYPSKDELVLAAYVEAKRELGTAAMARVDPDASAHDRFIELWLGAHRHLAAHPEQAKFLVQVDASPYAAEAHRRAMSDADDPVMGEAARPDMARRLAPLPFTVLYELGLAPAVRLAASEQPLSTADRRLIAEGCWRAITRPT
jgi:AcrR family transcriptional regulator